MCLDFYFYIPVMINLEIRENICLRELQIADAATFAYHANNKKVWDNLRDFFPHPYTVEDALRFIDFCSQQKQKSNFTISIDQEASGMIGCGIFKNEGRITAELGYWLGEKYWGRGIVRDAISVFTDYMFDHFDIIRIQAPVYEFNKPSMRVLEKNGYLLESVMQRSAIKNNKIIDQHLYVKFRPDK